MSDLKGLRAVVVGAGAVGSTTAFRLLRCGAAVTLIDSAPRGKNASGVAAGMLAPALEALTDPVSADHFPWLMVARNAWPDLIDSLSLPQTALARDGALIFAADEASHERLWQRLSAFDASGSTLSAAQAQAAAPGLKAQGPALFSAGDWRLDPATLLGALQEAFVREGGRWLPAAVAGLSDRGVRLSDDDEVLADVVILASGAAGAAWTQAPELALLTPIKGQILRFEGAAPEGGPIIRAPKVYVAPSASGPVAGATMEAGRADLTIDPEAVAALREAAARLYPALGSASLTALAGVRAASPDGLPIVGPSQGGRVMLAVGTRRNGWLLAPVIADVIVAGLRGLDAGAFGQAFDPKRFVFR